MIRTGMMEADSASIFIPFARGANYLKPIAWQELLSKAGKWTLQIGDVIVRGLVSDEISSSFTITNLKEKYDDTLTISSVDSMDSGSANLQHWRIGAKVMAAPVIKTPRGMIVIGKKWQSRAEI